MLKTLTKKRNHKRALFFKPNNHGISIKAIAGRGKVPLQYAADKHKRSYEEPQVLMNNYAVFLFEMFFTNELRKRQKYVWSASRYE
jgi:hypothetical protein